MPLGKRQSFCDVSFDAARNEVAVWHFSGVHTRARRTHVPKRVNRQALNQLIADYWMLVDENIRHGVVDGDDATAQQRLLDELKAFGSEIAKELFTKETQREIWKAASESDIFVLSTNLDEVPWEALFSRESGNRGEFLSDNCVIQRQLDSDQELAVQVTRAAALNHIVCLDPILAEEEDCARDLINRLQALGVELHQTSTKTALEMATSKAAVIHWICEHANQGLRLNKGVFYGRMDVDAHRFPSSCVLFMLSCGAGRYLPGCTSLSASIAASSGCTVVAPSSVVAAKAAVRFMLDIDELLRQSDLVNLSDVWFRLKNPLGGRRRDDGIKPGDCYLLWFGIYGDCDIPVRSVR